MRCLGRPVAECKGEFATSQSALLLQSAYVMRVVLSSSVRRSCCAGAFVAGLDAGHAYNTFPLMDGKLVPDEYWGSGGWRNAFENTAAVQLHHRALALSTLAGVTALWAGSRSLQLPRPCRLLVNGMLAMAGLQVIALLCCDMAALCSLFPTTAMLRNAASAFQSCEVGCEVCKPVAFGLACLGMHTVGDIIGTDIKLWHVRRWFWASPRC